jgi:transcriptional regulator GlxA family with amidase domain
MDPRIRRIIEQFEPQLHKRLSVADMAAAAGLSPSRFASLFRCATGMSPARYFRTLRLERARALLETTTLSVDEVRTLVGGSEGSHFARDYRARYGVGPRDSRLERNNGKGTVTERRTPNVTRHGEPKSIGPDSER